MDKPIITGYYGCSCHPFSSWDESKLAHKQKFEIGTPVEDRCTGKQGYIHDVYGDYFYLVKQGVVPRDNVQAHSAMLVKKESIDLKYSYTELVAMEKEWLENHLLMLEKMEVSNG